MIKDFWVLNTDGILLYNRNFTELEKLDNLLAGFFTAIKIFIEQTTQGEIKSIIMEKKKFSYILDENIVMVILTDRTDNDLLINIFLKQICMKFLSKYDKRIKHFSGDTMQFESFHNILEQEVEFLELLIRCKSCDKVIVNEFRTKDYENEKIYFCCSMCEKMYCDLNDTDRSEL